LLVGAYGLVAVWDLDRKVVTDQLTGMAGGVNTLAFSPDGKLLAVAGGKPYSPGEVRLYDARSLKPLATLTGHKEVVLSEAFSPDSKRLATVSYDKTAEIWDLAERRSIGSIKDHSDTIQCVAFDREGKTLATGGMDRIVKLSDGMSGKGLLTINPDLKGILTLAFSPDGKFLVTSGESPEIRWWDVANMSETVSERGWIPARKMAGHTGSVQELRFSPDGNTLASAGADHTVRLWDAATGRLLRTLIDADDLLYAVAFSPDSKRIAAAGGDGLTRVWDVKTGSLIVILVEKQGGSLAVEPNGHYNVSANWKDLIHR
jgi:WD40 repeat protein